MCSADLFGRQVMIRVSTYLNSWATPEAGFLFYGSVFGTDLLGPIMRMGDMPSQPGVAPLSAEEKNL